MILNIITGITIAIAGWLLKRHFTPPTLDPYLSPQGFKDILARVAREGDLDGERSF